jgi:UDP-N-acetyl-D-galactosamine dehydrogenase
MGAFVAQKLVKLLIAQDVAVRQARVGVLGLTFKENVPDLRNSRVPDILNELRSFGITASVHDALAPEAAARAEYGLELAPLELMRQLDALVLAVPHRAYLALGEAALAAMLGPRGVLVDVRAALDPALLPASLTYWSL